MNYNILSYIIYTPIIFFITIKVGRMFHKNGEVFLMAILKNNVSAAKNLNNILLTGYYLVNLGYSIVTISFWNKINNPIEMINTLSNTLGILIIILALLHYNNILWIKYIHKSNPLKQ